MDVDGPSCMVEIARNEDDPNASHPSLSRTSSCFSDDLYMSVRTSPVPDASEESDFLSMSSRHFSKSLDKTDDFVDATSENGLESGAFDNVATDIADDPFLSQFSALCAPPSLPQLVGSQPGWMALQDEIRELRQNDLVISKSLEESNLSIYGSALALRVIEEVRWYNEVSKDPELSRLVNEVDTAFPLAMHHSTSLCEEQFTISTPSSSRSRNSSFCVDSCRNILSEEARIRSLHKGVDEFILRRKLDPTWYHMAGNVISRAFISSPIRDPRVLSWVQDLVANFEQAISVPLTAVNSSEMMFNGAIVHLRGSSDWAPPRDAWIFTPTKTGKPSLASQNNRCAGCGTRLEGEMAKRVRLCEYYGKLFCYCCHDGRKFIIPSKILKLWNFSEAPVSDRAYRFLSETKDQAAIHVSTVEPALVQKVSVLRKVIQLREKLGHMYEFIQRCPTAEETITAHGNLKTLFTSLEKHLLHSTDVFSLSDLTRVHNKDLLSLLEPIVYYAKCHIETCKKCLEHAFVCCMCADATDLLFPFQTEKVHRCPECGSISHSKCASRSWRKLGAGKPECPKCARLKKQSEDRQRIASFSEG